MTVNTFLQRFPEFYYVAQTNPNFVLAKLNEAAEFVSSSEDAFGTDAETAVGYKAADLLLCSPLGEQARADSKVRPDYYKEVFESLKAACIIPIVVP
jgi:hypothetical protein